MPLVPSRPSRGRCSACVAVYVEDKIVFILRDRSNSPADNGVWLATTTEHHRSLRHEFPRMRSIRVFGPGVTGWQVLPVSAPDFEDAALRACDLVLARDPRIGKVPKGGITSRSPMKKTRKRAETGEAFRKIAKVTSRFPDGILCSLSRGLLSAKAIDGISRCLLLKTVTLLRTRRSRRDGTAAPSAATLGFRALAEARRQFAPRPRSDSPSPSPRSAAARSRESLAGRAHAISSARTIGMSFGASGSAFQASQSSWVQRQAVFAGRYSPPRVELVTASSTTPAKRDRE